MNTNAEMILARAAIDALGDLGIGGEVKPAKSHMDQGIDGVVTLTRDGKTVEYVFQVKKSFTRSLVGQVSLAFGEESGKRLLVTDYVTPPLADELRRRHIQFIDGAGNAYLDRRGLLVFVAGRRDPYQRGRQKTVRAFRGAGLRVGFVLVSVPALASAPLRTIASTARVALGSVSAVLEGLRELGFIAEVRGKRRLLHRERLLDQWTEHTQDSFSPRSRWRVSRLPLPIGGAAPTLGSTARSGEAKLQPRCCRDASSPSRPSSMQMRRRPHFSNNTA